MLKDVHAFSLGHEVTERQRAEQVTDDGSEEERAKHDDGERYAPM